jgi:hypothetical protein
MYKMKTKGNLENFEIFKCMEWARCFLWRQNNPEVNYSPTRFSGGECFWRRYHALGNRKGTFF